MLQLELVEYQTRFGVPLSAEAIGVLRDAAGISITPSAGVPGHFDLTPGSRVGTLSIEDLRIVIRPKIPIRNVLFLLSHAMDRVRWLPERSELAFDSTLTEFVIASFVGETRRALRRGVLQGYRSEENTSTTVRGRIRFDDQIRNRYGVFPPAEIRFDEFTEDIELNRVLVAALDCSARLRPRSAIVRSELRALRCSLERVRLVRYDARHLPDFEYTRLNSHYRPAIELGLLLLRCAAFELHHGSFRTSGFLVDMNQVFEDFVVRSLRDALGLSEREFPQNARYRSIHLDDAKSIRLEPDLSWWDGPRCLMVGDVKYKRILPGGVRHGDIYQLHAYCTALGLPSGLLIYAEGETAPRVHRVVAGGPRLECVTLRLDGSPEDIAREIGELAQEIRSSVATKMRPSQPMPVP